MIIEIGFDFLPNTNIIIIKYFAKLRPPLTSMFGSWDMFHDSSFLLCHGVTFNFKFSSTPIMIALASKALLTQ